MLKPSRPSDSSRALRERLGSALQEHRLRKELTQAQLAEMVDLSLKYLGEIERGEANTSLDVVERLARAVDWDPMETLEATQEPITEGVRVLVMADVRRFVDRFTTILQWLEALDPSLQTEARLAVPRVCMGQPVFIDAAGNIVPVPPTSPVASSESATGAQEPARRRARRRVIS